MSKGGYNGGSTVIRGGSDWIGRGSVTSQPGEKKKKPPMPAKPNRAKKAQKAAAPPAPSRSGLTRAEIVARAQQRVRRLEAEITKAQRNLQNLRRQHAAALAEAEEARSLPPKSAAGAERMIAINRSTKPTTAKNSVEQAALPKVGKRIVISAGPKGAVIEHRVARRRKADGADQA